MEKFTLKEIVEVSSKGLDVNSFIVEADSKQHNGTSLIEFNRRSSCITYDSDLEKFLMNNGIDVIYFDNDIIILVDNTCLATVGYVSHKNRYDKNLMDEAFLYFNTIKSISFFAN